jgi:carbon-monoxide dehydrogenase small subunit
VKVYRGDCRIRLTVNQEPHSLVVRPGETLLAALREKLGLLGAKRGCQNGDCGACTVLLDRRPVKSCLILALEAEGREVTTIEGLERTPVQEAFLREAGFQCGFCTPGFLLNAHALLTGHPRPEEATIRSWLESNLCRCTGYEGIERAVRAAAAAEGR